MPAKAEHWLRENATMVEGMAAALGLDAETVKQAVRSVEATFEPPAAPPRTTCPQPYQRRPCERSQLSVRKAQLLVGALLGMTASLNRP